MDKFMNWLEKKLGPLTSAISRNRYLVAIRDGFLLSTPMLIAGSVFLLLANFPIPNWDTIVAGVLGENWATYLNAPAAATFDVMTILAVFGIGYSLANQFKTDPIQAAIVSMVAFLIVTPFLTQFTPEGAETIYEVKSLPLKWMGSNGLFLGMIVALVASRLFVYFVNKGFTIKMPDSVPPTVTKSFEALIPGLLIVTIFMIINWLSGLTPYGNCQQIIFVLLQTPLLALGSTLPAMVIAYLFLHFFWFFGINGSSVVGAVYKPVLTTLLTENAQAFSQGQELPNIINQTFQDCFATMGGAGSTLSLIIVMLLFCHSERIKKLSRLSAIPGIFGINEPIIFGLPIVLSPILFIPFILVPTINIIISYFAMSTGLVPLTNGILLPWTTPAIISGFLATSSWQGAVLQLILLPIGCIIYYPFIKIMDRQYLREEAAVAAGKQKDSLDPANEKPVEKLEAKPQAKDTSTKDVDTSKKPKTPSGSGNSTAATDGDVDLDNFDFNDLGL